MEKQIRLPKKSLIALLTRFRRRTRNRVTHLNFDEFVKLSEEYATEMLTSTGKVRPAAYTCDDKGHIVILVLVVDKPMWRPTIKRVVKELEAVFFSFVDEAWYVQRDEYLPAIGSLANNPCRKELLHIFSYGKNGEKHVKIKPFKRIGNKIEFQDIATALGIEKPTKEITWKDQIVGNVFTDELPATIPVFPTNHFGCT